MKVKHPTRSKFTTLRLARPVVKLLASRLSRNMDAGISGAVSSKSNIVDRSDIHRTDEFVSHECGLKDVSYANESN